ncbi:hypothetical protein NUW58_g5075 [Xylaria curta]|uniref:Uncharacterized protein n=1 Tax=Xylaria curta TaxID=42375 RepID=A0ACC1P4H5_9PEZI|nr:hypothetical protein NUW58_g5075 [Xylaria curta]
MSDQLQPYRAPKPSRGGANETEPDYSPAAEPIVKVETNNFRQVLQHFNNDGGLINARTTRFSIPCAICQTRNLAINVQHEQLHDTSYEHYTVLMRCGHAFGYACLASWRSIDGVFEAAGQVPPSNGQNREGVSQNLDLEPRDRGLRRRTTIAGSEMTPPARLSLLDNSLGVMTQAVIMDGERGFQLVELDQPLLIQYMVTGARRPIGYPYVATRDEHGNYSWSEATSSDMANMSYRRYSY